MSEIRGWIGVDLDGTLAEYHGWVCETHIGQPIKPMVERVKKWLSEGHDVRIFTARVSVDDPTMKNLVVSTIKLWSMTNIGQILPVTNVKDMGMIELWDDRCVQVVPNKGVPVGSSTRNLD